MLDRYTFDSVNQNHKNKKQEDDIQNDIDEILSEVFQPESVIEGYRLMGPDFGFYSLSNNFYSLKSIALEQKKPDINDEFDRLQKKYQKK